MDEEDVREKMSDLFLHLKQMLQTSASPENNFETLLCLSEMDPTFHEIQLVQFIRRRLRNALTPNIDSCVKSFLEENRRKIQGESNLEYLTKKVSQDKAFVEFKSELTELLEIAVESMSRRQEEYFAKVAEENIFSFQKRSSPLNTADNSLNSSINQSGFLFLHKAQYTAIADGIQKKNPHDKILEALNSLLVVNPGEPVSQEEWPTIRKGLRDCLWTNQRDVFSKALKFHVRLLTSQVHIAVKEGFLNLLDGLSTCYMSKKLIQKFIYKKEETIYFHDSRVLVIINTVVEFLKEFPLLWIRYPVDYVEDMAEALFAGLELRLNETDRMSFLDLISLTDPKASWFVSWCHSHYGRTMTFSILRGKPAIVQYSLSYCLQYLNESQDYSFQRSTEYVKDLSLAFYKFNYCSTFLFCLIKYVEGREALTVCRTGATDQINVKLFLLTLGDAIRIPNKKPVIRVILKNISQLCYCNESLSMVICESGLVDILTAVLGDSECYGDFQTWSLTSILQLFISLNSTAVGHEYLLTGKLLKGATRAYLTANVRTPAQIIFAFTKTVLWSQEKWAAQHVCQLSAQLSCQVLHSPLARHLLLSDPLIQELTSFLQGIFGMSLADTLPTFCENKLPTNYIYIKGFVEILLTSYKGLILLEKSGLLSPVLDYALPELAGNSQITPKLLTYISSSERGSAALGKHRIVNPFWQVVKQISSNEITSSPLKFTSTDTLVEEFLFPIYCVASTQYGINMLFGKSGLQEDMLYHLLDPLQEGTPKYTAVLKVLLMATSNVNGLIFLQPLINLQEIMLRHQSRHLEAEVEDVIVDENSIIRSHILMWSFQPKGSASFDLRPFLVDMDDPDQAYIVDSIPPSEVLKGEKASSSDAKKRNEIGKFLSDQTGGTHDRQWLSNCRQAYRAQLISGEDTEIHVLMDLMEVALETLVGIEEGGLPRSKRPSSMTSDEHPEGGSGATEVNSKEDGGSRSGSDSDTAPSSFAADLMARYGMNLNLFSDMDLHKSNLMKLHLAVDTVLMGRSKCSSADWFLCLFYCLSEGNADLTYATLSKMKRLKVASVIWPSLLSNELLFAGIIHTTKLLLFRGFPTAFLFLEDFADGIIWNLLSEWIRTSFVSVLRWPENLHMYLVAILHGHDYFIYGLTALLLQVEKFLQNFSSETKFRKVLLLQTSLIPNWRIQEHFALMDSLSRRFRRIVNSTLDQLTNPK